MGGAIAIGECFVVQKDFNYWAIFLNYCRVKSTRMSNSIVARPGGEMVVVSKLISVGSVIESWFAWLILVRLLN